MSQNFLFTPYGGMQVKKDTSYTKDNISADADIVVLTRGVRITDELGNKTKLRGIKMSVSNSVITAPVAPLPNIPIIWLEGNAFAFDADSTYTFFDDGIVAYGKRIVV